MSKPAGQYCGCCGKQRTDWDGLYGCCGGCAWLQSLEHDPCCHGDCYPPLAEDDNARHDAVVS